MTRTIAEPCCGIGTIGEAFAQARFTPAWACDTDEVARDTYQANHGIRPLGDLWDIVQTVDELPDADVVAMGMPCQPFSSMGDHGCWADPRSHVLVPLMKLLCRRRPRVVVIENVEGMTHNKKAGRPLDLLLRALASCGYAANWDVLDAAEFGGCQHRPRVFVVASRDGRLLDFSRLARRPAGRIRDVLEQDVPESNWWPPSRYVLLDPPFKMTRAGLIPAAYVPGREIRGRTDVTRLATHHHAARIYHPEGLAPTLMCRSGLSLLRVGDRVRPPTLLELQRIQGLPDSWRWPHGDMRRCELIGQAVHVPTVRAVAAAILEQLM
jgi:site-specific DNA-cytosine methylase